MQLHEAAPHAGGRCRSYFDAELGCRIDNGNHLLLAGNSTALDYLERIGARGTLQWPGEAVFPFLDAASGERWAVRPNRGVVPWWILQRDARVPETRAPQYLGRAEAAAGSAVRNRGSVCSAGKATLYRRLWEPLAIAALNTSAEQGSARMFWRILADTLGRGGEACRPLLAADRSLRDLCRACPGAPARPAAPRYASAPA